MATDRTPDVDALSGMQTTGHEWDGIRELNTPLPRWWLWIFYATIVWSIGYWVVYPSWPLLTTYTQGLFGWNSRAALQRDLAELKIIRGPLAARIATAQLDEIVADNRLLDFARAQARPIFNENCAGCHGVGGAGTKGYPNLNDDEWLWGGKLDDISASIRHGIRSNDPKTRLGVMPAFGRDGLLKRPEIEAVADYVRSLARLPVEPGSDLAAGAKVYADHCAACHGAAGKGNRELGSPNLSDAIWLYGSDKPAIIEGLWNGRGGVMPAWHDRLDDSTIKALTVYVHSLGGGER